MDSEEEEVAEEEDNVSSEEGIERQRGKTAMKKKWKEWI